ncbi:hypothetical protein DW182_12150 [Bacteroides sp. AM16-24]|jgi:hypothetical protein|uniref:hypothetical protein n=1 Tax=Bacteroides TaxID=816 RepID=UPI000E43F6DE|nr:MULTISPECIES: hypothetical protein [Bacteroides]RGK24235.1 hypothetical protein DXD27_11720 [Bacteroides intestinalis]RGX82848.1 hypothetical protein DXA61_19640 [Bacteroides intestinalis]RHI07874.1 hypothetical protein DW182_12150 [Bacteroides sp. AM16-24]
MTNFEKWDKEFRAQNLYAFNHDINGLLWLKVRAVCRSKQIEQFIVENNITLAATKIAEQNVELFGKLEGMPNAMQLLDDYLKVKSHNWYDAMGIDEAKLKADLYKVQHYAWGGDQNNSLDKHFVSRYVKVISNYDDLVSKQTEIADNAWHYVQTSWYNNWTSYLIESLFKRHEKVISAVGEIKSVDFFIDNNPIDLKVTFFPNQYMDEKLKDKLGKKELTWLKQKAKEVGITVDNTLSESQQMYTLSEKLSEIGRTDILDELKTKRKDVITDAQANTMELMTWLYANQGEMRFGAENRLFVILVDTTDMSQSWKMKRAFSLIEPKVNDYLNYFNANSLKEVNFTFKKDRYKSLADIVFVVK